MSYLVAVPEMLQAAATDLAGIGSTLSEANAAAAAPTTGLLAAGADEVSAAVTVLFSSHAQAFQALSAEAAAFHQQFVQLLTSAGGSYAATDASSASPLQTAKQDF
ncbi:MAG: PE family protein, partial [Mycobacterium sp.]